MLDTDVVSPNGLHLNANPHVLPRLAPCTRKHVTDGSMTDDAGGEVVVDLPYRWMRADEGFGYAIFVKLDGAILLRCRAFVRRHVSRLLPIDDEQGRDRRLSNSIRCRPVAFPC